MKTFKYLLKLKRIDTRMSYRKKLTKGWILKGLSRKDKIYVINAYKESLNPKNLISHDIVKAQFSKWLSK